MKNIAVYTAIINGRDTLVDPPFVSPDCDYICFSDAPHTSAVWDVRVQPRTHQDPCRDAKSYKVLSHLHLPEYEYTLWIDGSHSIATDPLELVETYLYNKDIALMAHPNRTCMYEEAAVCMHLKLDNTDRIDAQIQRYKSENFPENDGLYSCGIILRRNAPNITALNEAWWKEITDASRRDQISFPYCLKKTHTEAAIIPGHYYKNPLFPHHGHSVNA